jgi:histidinol phosphatase-like PHP family hydrolase
METFSKKNETINTLLAHRDTCDVHAHTHFTDGQDSIALMCGRARQNGLSFLVLSEHVRQKVTYDYTAFVDQVHSHSVPGFTALAGCEAKVLDESGGLDISPHTAKLSRVCIASFHGKIKGKSTFLKRAHAMLDNPLVDIWGHPFSLGVHLDFGDWRKLCEHARTAGVVIEVSDCYPMQERYFKILERSCPYLLGSDAHAHEEIRKAHAPPTLLPE